MGAGGAVWFSWHFTVVASAAARIASTGPEDTPVVLDGAGDAFIAALTLAGGRPTLKPEILGAST